MKRFFEHRVGAEEQVSEHRVGADKEVFKHGVDADATVVKFGFQSLLRPFSSIGETALALYCTNLWRPRVGERRNDRCLDSVGKEELEECFLMKWLLSRQGTD